MAKYWDEHGVDVRLVAIAVASLAVIALVIGGVGAIIHSELGVGVFFFVLGGLVSVVIFWALYELHLDELSEHF